MTNNNDKIYSLINDLIDALDEAHAEEYLDDDMIALRNALVNAR